MDNFYYSQFAEDLMLSKMFDKDYKGFFVDIGALDGIWLSNTYMMEQKGWGGIAVEAHPDFAALVKKNRKCIALHVAAGDEDKDECTFHANYMGSLSTLNPNQPLDAHHLAHEPSISIEAAEKALGREHQLQDVFNTYGIHYGKREDIHGDAETIGGFANGEVTVPMMTIDSIIEKNLPPDQSIDFISIDIDGSEPIALKGFTLERWHPRFIMFEISIVPNSILDYMKDKDYEVAFVIGDTNVIYCRDPEDINKLKEIGRDVAGNLSLYTQHKGTNPVLERIKENQDVV